MPKKPGEMERLAGTKVNGEKHFPVTSLEDVLREIRRTSGTGKLEIHFANGKARGEAHWKGFARESS